MVVDNGLSMEGYDQVIRAMQDAGKQAADRNPLTGRIENTTNSVFINARAAELRDQLRAQNPAYDTAVGRYGDDMAYADAFRQGGDVGKLTGHEVNAQARALPEQAREAWSAGAGTAMADAASQFGVRHPNGNTANHVRQMLGDDIKQEAIGNIGGNANGLRALQDRLEAEHQGHLNWQSVDRNERAASRQDTDGLNGSIPTTMRGIAGRLVDYVTAHAAPQYQRDLKQRLGEIVSASDAQSVDQVMRELHEQAQRDRRFGDLLHKSGVIGTGVYGANVAPTDPVPEEFGR